MVSNSTPLGGLGVVFECKKGQITLPFFMHAIMEKIYIVVGIA